MKPNLMPLFFVFAIQVPVLVATAQGSAPDKTQIPVFSPTQQIDSAWQVKGWKPATPDEIRAAEDAPHLNLKPQTRSMEAISGVPINKPGRASENDKKIYKTAGDVLGAIGSCKTFDDVSRRGLPNSDRATCVGAFLSGQKMQVMDLQQSELFVDANVMSSHPAIRLGWRIVPAAKSKDFGLR